MSVEPVALVVVASFGRGTCRRCLARVVWYQTVGGSWLPFDGSPRVERLRREDSLVGSPMVGEIRRAALHWSKCDASNMRSRRGSRP